MPIYLSPNFLLLLDFMYQVMGEYGYSIEHILMVDIIPDPSVRRAMNEINAGNNTLWLLDTVSSLPMAITSIKMYLCSILNNFFFKNWVLKDYSVVLIFYYLSLFQMILFG
jgi:hypothetical protein